MFTTVIVWKKKVGVEWGMKIFCLFSRKPKEWAETTSLNETCPVKTNKKTQTYKQTKTTEKYRNNNKLIK